MRLDDILSDREVSADGLRGKLATAYRNLRGKVSSFLDKPFVRPYLAAVATMSIFVANWSKDFGVNSVVGLPFLYESTNMKGTAWYNLAYLQEGATMGGLVATAKNKIKMGAAALLYEAASTVNMYLFYQEIGGRMGNMYGILWNDIFYLFQVPLYFLSLAYYMRGYLRSGKKQPKEQH